MPTADPAIGTHFRIDFQGKIKGAFRECTGMGSEHEVVEYKASDEKGRELIKKVPGRMKWNNITLKRGIVANTVDMWNWRKDVEEGNIDKARTNGSIILCDGNGTEIARWDFNNAWPCKLVGPAPNAANSEIAIEELEITHEGYTRKN